MSLNGSDPVLVIAKDYTVVPEIMASYGFHNAITAPALHAQQPLLYADVSPADAAELVGPARVPIDDENGVPVLPPVDYSPAAYDPSLALPLKAVLILIDPLLWGREAQIATDVLRGNVHLGGEALQAEAVRKRKAAQAMEAGSSGSEVVYGEGLPFLLNACADFEYVNEHDTPRFGAGSFGCALEVGREGRGGGVPYYWGSNVHWGTLLS